MIPDPTPRGTDPRVLAALSAAWECYPPEPELLALVNDTPIRSLDGVGSLLACDAKHRAELGLGLPLDVYQRLAPDFGPATRLGAEVLRAYLAVRPLGESHSQHLLGFIAGCPSCGMSWLDRWRSNCGLMTTLARVRIQDPIPSLRAMTRLASPEPCLAVATWSLTALRSCVTSVAGASVILMPRCSVSHSQRRPLMCTLSSMSDGLRTPSMPHAVVH